MKAEVTHDDRLMPAVSRLEWMVVIGLVLVGAAFRLLALNDVPPGLHHDEVIIGQAAKDILRGHLAIYFTGGYGQEPLYHYVLAGFFALFGASAFVLRLTSAFVAILGLAITYRFTRRLFSSVVAVGTLAWMSISLWPVFFARVGLRGITLPLLTTLTAYFLWKAVHELRTTNCVVAGALLGLSIYTYQASRVFPLIFLVFLIYLAVTHSSLVIAKHPCGTRYSVFIRRGLVFFATALLIAAPLIVYLTVINPSAEERVADLSGPLIQLSQGKPDEVIHSTLNTLGMFTIAGDVVPIYNVGGRPVFPEPIGAALFYMGVLVCLWRWKQPAYALMLIWFVISLMPAMATPFSPNFVRTIAAWPVPFVFAGLGMQSMGQLVSRLIGQSVNWSIGRSEVQPRSYHVILSPSHLVTIVFALVITFNTFLTYRDYFLDWPRGDYVRFWQQATWTQAVRAINADSATTPVAASGLSIQDYDPQTFDLLSVRSDVKVKWFDCRNAILYPRSPGDARYLSPDFFACDADLWSTWLPNTQLLAQPRWPDTNNIIFTLQQSDPIEAYQSYISIRERGNQTLFVGGERFDVQSPKADLVPIGTPNFGGLKSFGTDIKQNAVHVGDTFDVLTFWMVMQPIAPPLKIFVHVTSPDGKIVAQWDGLDVNIATLEPHDLFIERHRIELPADLPTGPYRVSLGVYHPDSGQRLIAQLPDRTIDSVVLTMIDVK